MFPFEDAAGLTLAAVVFAGAVMPVGYSGCTLYAKGEVGRYEAKGTGGEAVGDATDGAQGKPHDVAPAGKGMGEKEYGVAIVSIVFVGLGGAICDAEMPVARLWVAGSVTGMVDIAATALIVVYLISVLVV